MSVVLHYTKLQSLDFEDFLNNLLTSECSEKSPIVALPLLIKTKPFLKYILLSLRLKNQAI